MNSGRSKMMLLVLSLALLAIVGLPQSVSADGVAVGTNLSLCNGGSPPCGGATIFILPGQFLAQGFTLNSTTSVSDIFFTIGTAPVTADPSNPVLINYPALTFDMRLTTGVGPGTPLSSLLTTSPFTVSTSGPQFEVLSFSVNQVLSAGTYYLVASSKVPIPNSSMVLGWVEASNYFPNAGPALGAAGEMNVNSTIWQLMLGCPQTDCKPNEDFPPASAFEPVSGPVTPTPFQFQVCSNNGGTDCGAITTAAITTAEPGSLLLLGIGMLGAFASRRRRDSLPF
jgi:hypothetical protein